MEKRLRLIIDPKPGIVIRVALVLERRGYSMESMKISRDESDLAVMHLHVEGENGRWEQIKKQLVKLIDVVEVTEVSQHDIVAVAEVMQEV
jgi:acetolactate synthase-1/3 small subunit